MNKSNGIKKIYFLSMFIIILLCNGTPAIGKELLIRHISPDSREDLRSLYYIDILRLALQKTENSDGAFKLTASKVRMNQGRALKSLKQNIYVDVVWTMTSKEREDEFLPVRIPLLKGLLGHRIFIIREDEADRFAAIQTFDQLKQLTAGQGGDWPDTEILRSNGIKVVESFNDQGLFGMLERRRFDYFPRGLNEPWTELKVHKEYSLMVEETLLIQYPAPIYFFVNSENTRLAKRLEKGLRLAIKDGSFNELFLNHPANKDIFELSNIDKRKIFRLNNPFLTPDTPLDEKALWYAPQER